MTDGQEVQVQRDVVDGNAEPEPTIKDLERENSRNAISGQHIKYDAQTVDVRNLARIFGHYL